MSRFHRRSAYYSRNQSYSRSLNAENAEADGRLPRTRAAKHLGVSAAAFTAGCAAAGYVSTEWHHVGKYATMVDYYDTNELAENPDFWQGAATAYKAKAKQAELLARFTERADAARAVKLAEFARQLKRQMQPPEVVRHQNRNWQKIVQKIAAEHGGELPGQLSLAHAPGDFTAARFEIFAALEKFLMSRHQEWMARENRKIAAIERELETAFIIDKLGATERRSNRGNRVLVVPKAAAEIQADLLPRLPVCQFSTPAGCFSTIEICG